jgi:hypothetical protein
MAPPFDRRDEHALMLRARPGDSLRNDPALFGDEPLKLLVRLVVDEILFVIAKSAGTLFPDLAG